MKFSLNLMFICWIIFVCSQMTENEASDNDGIEQYVISPEGKVTHGNDDKKNQNNTHHQQTITNQQTKKPKRKHTAMGIVIKNSRSYPVKYYWWSGSKSVYQGPIRGHREAATNSYVGHVFYFTITDRKTGEETEFHRFTVIPDVNQYILPPLPGKENDPHYLSLLQEKRFVEEYFERTGRPWLAHHSRKPPIHHMWAADYIGQTHTVTSSNTYWNCVPESDPPLHEEIEKCQSNNGNNITLDLEVISIEPRAFRILNTLSETECDLIVELSQPKVKRSRAGQDGGLETNTRTSKNTWLGRRAHYILDTVYQRAADIVNISADLLRPRSKGNIVEEMQVLKYQVGEEYTSHHDFGANGRPNQRYITLLFYLNDQLHENAGGETNFPKANDGDGLKAHPGKGSSIMFYSILPDGNADDKSLHAALPVREGIKWLANFWIWDPER